MKKIITLGIMMVLLVSSIVLSWNYNYKQIPFEEITYKTIKINITEPVYNTVCKEETDKSNGTKYQNCSSSISKFITTEQNKSIVDTTSIKYKNSTKIININIYGINYSNTNVVGNNLIRWTVPIGDRNFIEYPSCRIYELQKGVCSIQRLDSPNLTMEVK